MKVIFGISRLNSRIRRPVLAVGVFDGVHLGHQHLIKKMIQKARAIEGTAMVVTFFPHPIQVLRPDIDLPLLTSLEYRLKLMERLGVDVCLVVRFTKRFAQLKPENFIQRYFVQKIKPQAIYIGDDFRFGKNRGGDLRLLKDYGQKYGFAVNIIASVCQQKDIISSTAIRQYTRSGELQKARRLLGRRVSIFGKVVKGDSRGRHLGYPTANIDPYACVLIPQGVYLVQVLFHQRVYQGMCNLGRRPSFPNNGTSLSLEVHIFDFQKNIYGEDVIVEFIQKIRDERHFTSQKTLMAQLQKDEKKARSLLSKILR